MIVPHEQLNPDTLSALIEEFVTRDGAVHGHSEMSADQMTAGVLRRLRDGSAVILFDEASESCTIMSKIDASAAERAPVQSDET